MTFELWRQDDNGNLFLVGVFPERAAAERMMAELGRHPHKQTYWISEREDELNSTFPDDGLSDLS